MISYLRGVARAKVALTDAEKAGVLRRANREARRARAKRAAITGRYGRMSQRQTRLPHGRVTQSGSHEGTPTGSV